MGVYDQYLEAKLDTKLEKLDKKLDARLEKVETKQDEMRLAVGGIMSQIAIIQEKLGAAAEQQGRVLTELSKLK